jgi:O-antigen ligase
MRHNFFRAMQAGGLLVLLMPLALLHARAVAEILIAVMDALFLLRCWLTTDWGWLRQPFAVAACLWWAWLIICSAVGTGGLLLALVALRLPLFALALGEYHLALLTRRRALWWVLAAAFAWIVLETWQQYLLGTNLFGQARWLDGALTGPFNKPRAGPALILICFPVLLPAVLGLLAHPGHGRRIAAGLLTFLAVATMILIGQRMPTMLMLLGLLLTGLLLPRLRLPVAATLLAAALLVAATPIIAPDTYDKLVVHFTDQIRHFPESSYGLIYARALHIAADHPSLGQGFDAFRRGCPAAAGAACNIHPHNYYLEAADDGGLPLLVLFCVMVATALWRLGKVLRRPPDALSTGLFVGAILAFWPVASTSAFTSMPNAGWVFLCLGLGFATTQDPRGVALQPDRTR